MESEYPNNERRLATRPTTTANTPTMPEVAAAGQERHTEEGHRKDEATGPTIDTHDDDELLLFLSQLIEL